MTGRSIEPSDVRLSSLRGVDIVDNDCDLVLYTRYLIGSQCRYK